MQDRQHVHIAATNAVNGDERRSGDDQFPCAGHPSGTPTVGKTDQPGYCLANARANSVSGGGPLLRDIGSGFIQVG